MFNIFFYKNIVKRLITEFFGWVAEKNIKFITLLMIKFFIKIYKINMSEYKETNIKLYLTFNDFFIRSLKENVRKITSGKQFIIQPADGKISQIGFIDNIYIFQAKGRFYNLNSLLANQRQLTDVFCNGNFITTYLSPKDYHRVHMPCDGLLKEMLYVPGKLFSVSDLSVKNVPNLFTRNERLICVFKTHIGLMIQILIGSIIVGSINTVWCGCVNKNRKSGIKRLVYPKINCTGSVFLKKGEEMGFFKLGSTVINLFESNKIVFNNKLIPGSITRVGELLAKSINNKYIDNIID